MELVRWTADDFRAIGTSLRCKSQSESDGKTYFEVCEIGGQFRLLLQLEADGSAAVKTKHITVRLQRCCGYFTSVETHRALFMFVDAEDDETQVTSLLVDALAGSFTLSTGEDQLRLIEAWTAPAEAETFELLRDRVTAQASELTRQFSLQSLGRA